MITGTIDYTEVGENIITLNYNGLTKQAIVEVKRGVIIEHSKSDTITILKGTNKDNVHTSYDTKNNQYTPLDNEEQRRAKGK